MLTESAFRFLGASASIRIWPGQRRLRLLRCHQPCAEDSPLWAVSILSPCGFVAPPVSVSTSALGAGTAAPVGLLAGEVVVIRRAQVDELTFERLDHEELAAEADDVLVGQRSELFSVPGVQAAYETLLDHERAIISCALADAPARRVLVPTSWTSEQAVGALARELELDS